MTLPAQTIQSHKPIKCVVIQLARLGDTLQSLMALRAAKQLYPGLDITFIAREKFADGAKKVPWINQVVTLPTDTLLGPVLNGKRTDREALKDLARWMAPIITQPWDMAINWSYSEASSYLTGLIPSRVKLGYTRRKDLTLLGADGWSHYIQGIVQGKIHQNIHLTDVLTTQLLTALQIHYGDPQSDGNAPVTSKNFFSLEMGSQDIAWGWNDFSKKWIAFQLGAGKESKTWPAERWARLAHQMLTRHSDAHIVLLGGAADLVRAKEVLSHIALELPDTTRVVSLVGQTDFDLWASVVARCQWLVAGDTAAIHLASVLGTRVINLSIGPVRWAETGPYGNGHYVIAPDAPQPSEEVMSGEAVYGVWSYGLNEWISRREGTLADHFQKLGLSDHLASIRVLRSRIRTTQDGGGVTYESILPRPLRLEDWTAMVVGHIARSWYCGWVPPIGTEISRDLITPPLVQVLRAMSESSDVMYKICEEAKQTAKALGQRSASLKSNRIMDLTDREEIQKLAAKLGELDTLIERLAATHPPLKAFSHMLKVFMHNLPGQELAQMGRDSAEGYRQLQEGVRLFKDWIKHTLQLARPVAIQASPTTPGSPHRKDVNL